MHIVGSPTPLVGACLPHLFKSSSPSSVAPKRVTTLTAAMQCRPTASIHGADSHAQNDLQHLRHEHLCEDTPVYYGNSGTDKPCGLCRLNSACIDTLEESIFDCTVVSILGIKFLDGKLKTATFRVKLRGQSRKKYPPRDLEYDTLTSLPQGDQLLGNVVTQFYHDLLSLSDEPNATPSIKSFQNETVTAFLGISFFKCFQLFAATFGISTDQHKEIHLKYRELINTKNGFHILDQLITNIFDEWHDTEMDEFTGSGDPPTTSFKP